MVNNSSETLTYFSPQITSIVPAMWYTGSFEASFLKEDVKDMLVSIDSEMAK